MEAPEDDQSPSQIEYVAEAIGQLDLDEAGIGSIIWATGYLYDYSWIDFPVFDEMDYPKQEQGVTEQPGLYFVGLHFLETRKSGLLLGVGEDAAHVAEHIAQQERQPAG